MVVSIWQATASWRVQAFPQMAGSCSWGGVAHDRFEAQEVHFAHLMTNAQHLLFHFLTLHFPFYQRN
jgi:hypothetical protein